MHRLALHWFRRDLRLTDNAALALAAASSRTVLPVYILSEWKKEHHWTGPIRQGFLCGCLETLAGDLQARGYRLVFRQGKAEEALEALLTETRADALFYNRDPDPFGQAAEARVKAMARRLGVAVHDCKDVVLHEPDEVLNGQGKPYRVYTPYSKKWLALPKLAPVGEVGPLAQTPDAIPAVVSLPVPTLAHWGLSPSAAQTVPPGEKAARQRLQNALDLSLSGYGQTRNIPSSERGTSRLSQDLRFGLLSAREIYHRVGLAQARATESSVRQSLAIYIKELAWREFNMAILRHFPEVLRWEFNPDYRQILWGRDRALLQRWREGQTGFPIVDAGMRELAATGFMHNRVRMITSMFLSKDLRQDWRLGESWFMRHLADGEIASNNGGWQWCAGTGADAAPWFRIQNPWTQTKNFDPGGLYIKRWVPELEAVPASRFLAPPRAGESLAPAYPAPMVNHHAERDKTLNFFRKHRIKARAMV